MAHEVNIKVVLLENFDKSFSLPSYQTDGAAGADLQASLGPGESLKIGPGERVLVPTGLSFEIPQGYEVQIRPRSGMSFKTTLMVVNSPGTIDSDYRGEIKVILGNWGAKDQVIEHGDRIAQMVVAPVVRGKLVMAQTLSESERGAGGFGSTGKQ